MAEINSRQAANIASGIKNKPADAIGKKRVLVITSPATAAWAQNDTIASGIPLPIGTRFLADSISTNAALGTGVTLDVGIRNFKTKAVIDADGIAAAIDVAAAGVDALNNGALVKDGAEYVTTEVVEVYATLGGANPTDNAQFRLEISYLATD